MRILVAGLLLVAALAGCSNSQQHQASNDAKDAYLVAAVKTKLATVDVDSSTAVNVAAANGVVTLSGQTKNAGEGRAYVEAARSVDGVTSVVDRLAVNPRLHGVREQTADAALAARVSAAIAAQAGVNVFHVTASAHGGVVTLEGSVPQASIHRTIVDTTRGVSGVRRVVDRVTVKP